MSVRPYLLAAVAAIHSVAALAAPRATETRLEAVKEWHQEKGAVIVTTVTSQSVRLEHYGHGIVRVRSSDAHANQSQETGMLVPTLPNVVAPASIDDSVETLKLSYTSNLELWIQKNPLRLTFWDPTQGKALLTDAEGPVWTDQAVEQKFQPTTDEHFVGLGHGYYGRVAHLDLKGSSSERNYGKVQIDQSPLIVPFYLSSRGYGVFVNSGQPNQFHFDDHNAYGFRLAGSTLSVDYVFLGGPDLQAVLGNYVTMTGHPRLPPRAVFGLALSDKAEPGNAGASWWMDKVAKHRALGWPIDHMVNDNRWREGAGQRCDSAFGFDSVRYPDPAAFQNWVKQMGLITTLDFNRCIAKRSKDWQPAYNIPKATGFDFADSAPDLTNPKARGWWWQLMFNKAFDPSKHYPGDALWVDEFDEMGPLPASLPLANGVWESQRNLWFLHIAEAVGRDGWDKSVGSQKRPFIWARGMTAGGQRHATLWSGDINPTFAEMALQVRGMQAAGLSGFPYWGHDAGGFQGDGKDELIYRQWAMAFGSFTPYWRPHGLGQSRWPGDRSDATKVDAEKFLKLRYELMPYIYQAAHQASVSGIPMARPMLLDYGDQAEAWSRDLQYMWGDSFLVAPAFGPTPNAVWLPKGQWYDFWTDTKLSGDQVVQPRSVTGVLPLYVKAGSIIPRVAAAPATAFIQYDALTLHVYVGASQSVTLYNDDGVTENFRSGATETSTVSFDNATLTTDITAVKGTLGLSATRTMAIAIHGLSEPKCLMWNDTPLSFQPTKGTGAYWDSHTHVLFAQLPTLPKSETIHIATTTGCSLPVMTRMEAEASVTDGSVGLKPSASGGGYVGHLEADGSHVTFPLTLTAASKVALRLGVANGSTKSATRHVRIDNEVVSVTVAPTNDWDAFSAVDVWAGTLAAGAHKVTLFRDAGDQQTLDVDYLDVIRVP